MACRVQSERGFRYEAKDRVPRGTVVRDEAGSSPEGCGLYYRVHLSSMCLFNLSTFSMPNYERGYFR